MKKAVALVLMLLLGACLLSALSGIPQAEYRLLHGEAPARIVQHGMDDTGAVNLVTGVLFDYRSFDTLGESTVIFTAVAGIMMLFLPGQVPLAGKGLSSMAKRSVDLLLPFVLIVGLYVISHGHISPGGGFQGGTIWATLTILMCIVYGTQFESQFIEYDAKKTLESAAAVALLLVGAVALFAGYPFLSNLAAGFPGGTPGQLVSAGHIPWLNAAVGMKVAAGLSLIFYSMVKKKSGEG